MGLPSRVHKPLFKRSSGLETHRALARGLLGRAMGFRDCSPATLDLLLASMTSRTYGGGEYLGRRGDRFGYLAVVMDGLLAAGVARADGHHPLLAMFQRGEVLGILEMLDGKGMANDLMARIPTLVALIPARVVREAMAVDPALAVACARQCAARCRHIYRRITTQGQSSVETRLVELLCILARRHGKPDGNEIRIDLRLSQADLADWVGASRQRVNAVLKTLEADRIVSLRHAAVAVLDMNRLKARAQV